MITIKEIILNGIHQLTESTTPRVDVELLLMKVLDCSLAFLKAHPEQEISDAMYIEFKRLLTRRAAGEPVAYILGEKEFWNFAVKVSKDVLVPRPDTELLVEKALEKIRFYYAKNHDIAMQHDRLNLLDLGTGSGIIAIALALEMPMARVFAVDISQAALDIAIDNAQKNKVNNISFYHGDLFASLSTMRGKFACIVSNPPYISHGDPHLNNKELQYEPKQALIAGIDGLDVLKLIIIESQNFLIKQGWLLVEHGYNQANAVHKLFVENNYTDITSYIDLSGHIRVTVGCKK